MGPNYQRPKLELPSDFRGGNPQPDGVSIADTHWSELFGDEVLSKLISLALEQNYDLRIAAERVVQARAQFGISESDLYPTLDLTGTFAANRNSQVGSNRFIPAGIST